MLRSPRPVKSRSLRPAAQLVFDQKSLWPLTKPARGSASARPGLSCLRIPVFRRSSLPGAACATRTASAPPWREVIYREAIVFHQGADLLDHSAYLTFSGLVQSFFQCLLFGEQFLVRWHLGIPLKFASKIDANMRSYFSAIAMLQAVWLSGHCVASRPALWTRNGIEYRLGREALRTGRKTDSKSTGNHIVQHGKLLQGNGVQDKATCALGRLL